MQTAPAAAAKRSARPAPPRPPCAAHTARRRTAAAAHYAPGHHPPAALRLPAAPSGGPGHGVRGRRPWGPLGGGTELADDIPRARPRGGAAAGGRCRERYTMAPTDCMLPPCAALPCLQGAACYGTCTALHCVLLCCLTAAPCSAAACTCGRTNCAGARGPARRLPAGHRDRHPGGICLQPGAAAGRAPGPGGPRAGGDGGHAPCGPAGLRWAGERPRRPAGARGSDRQLPVCLLQRRRAALRQGCAGRERAPGTWPCNLLDASSAACRPHPPQVLAGSPPPTVLVVMNSESVGLRAS